MTDTTTNAQRKSRMIDGRRLGPLGTASRVLLGAGLLVAAVLLGVGRLDALVGLVGANLFVVAALALRGRHAGPLRATSSTGHCVNLAIGVVFFGAMPVAAMLFYGTAMLLAAAAGSPGCEMFVVSNLVRGRDDQIGCPVFAPVDAIDAGHGHNRSPCC